MATEARHWATPFLSGHHDEHRAQDARPLALIILNQPFSLGLLRRVWNASSWRACADGGANRLYDVLTSASVPTSNYLPDLIKGDLDSLRDDVRRHYFDQDIPVIKDSNEYTTDLMKCLESLQELEKEGQTYDVLLLGGLSGRLDQTVHTLHYLHKLRRTGRRVFAVTDDNVGWVLDAGEHYITIDHAALGKTCGLLPVGVDSTILSTKGLEWNLDEAESSFEGLVSTSNHLMPGQDVWVRTSRPIWWTAELRPIA
ncbi:unnamed protein product [Peniophora sp. CBMAI 1063]|nr:unnamed protein product [Peniophora sp. CBMAI 1063]